jgi:hypothetical protein
MGDYRKLNPTHRLSSYQIKLSLWHGAGAVRTPFAAWGAGQPLAWYQAYNATKHDRHQSFDQASFKNLLDAVCGLVAILGAQFHTQDFSPVDYRVVGGPPGGFDVAIGGYFQIKFPDDWPNAERCAFDWQTLRNDPAPIQSLTFPA